MIADVMFSDEGCVCCGESVKKASSFSKFHAGCLKRMGDRVSTAQRKEAFKQKRRINEAKDKAFEKAMKEAEKEAEDEPENESERESEKEPQRESEKTVEEMSRNIKRARYWGDDQPLPKRRMDAPCQSDAADETCISGRQFQLCWLKY
jgi:hypothetical protein